MQLPVWPLQNQLQCQLVSMQMVRSPQNQLPLGKQRKLNPMLMVRSLQNRQRNQSQHHWQQRFLVAARLFQIQPQTPVGNPRQQLPVAAQLFQIQSQNQLPLGKQRKLNLMLMWVRSLQNRQQLPVAVRLFQIQSQNQIQPQPRHHPSPPPQSARPPPAGRPPSPAPPPRCQRRWRVSPSTPCPTPALSGFAPARPHRPPPRKSR